MMNKTISLLILSISCTFTACTSTPIPQQSLSSYLDQFVGQSSTHLDNHFNLESFGFSGSNKPLLNSDRAIVFRIQRPLTIPIPSFTGQYGGSSGWTASSSGSLSEAYDVNLNCDIHFHISNDIITKWSLSGPAC